MPTPSPLAPGTPIPGVTPTDYVPGVGVVTPGSVLDKARKGKAAGLPNNGLDPAKDLPNALTGGTYGAVTDIGGFLSKLSNVYLWQRIGIVAVGVAFIWWGILIFLASNKQIKGALVDGAKAVISKTPQGAAANIATGTLGV